MTQLSNTNLLDEQVGGNLKNERLEKTSQIAQNPNTEIKKQVQQPQQQQMPQNEQENIERKYEDEQVPNNLPTKDYGRKQTDSDADEKKILGMKPMVFYGLLAVGLGVAGYFAYKHFKGKNGKGSKSVDAGAGTGTGTKTATTTTTTKDIKITEVPIT